MFILMAVVGGVIIPIIVGMVNSNFGMIGSISVFVFSFGFNLIIPLLQPGLSY